MSKHKNEPLFDEEDELSSEQKAKEQVDAIRAMREWKGKKEDINWKKMESIENLINLFDNEEIDDFECMDSIREIIEI